MEVWSVSVKAVPGAMAAVLELEEKGVRWNMRARMSVWPSGERGLVIVEESWKGGWRRCRSAARKAVAEAAGWAAYEAIYNLKKEA